MRIYKCILNGDNIHEDELPEDLPNELYNWWYANSWVDGVRIGPVIRESDWG